MKHAAVTGAGGGLGVPICADMRESGWDVIGLAHVYGWDVTQPSFEEMVNVPHLQPVDALVCCHAAPIGASFEQQIAIDLIGAYNACMAVLPGMVARHWGRIVLLGSIRAAAPRPGQIGYAVAKAGIEGLARAIAVEYGHHGITCNVVAPGAVLTPRTTANIAAGIVSEAELLARTPVGRLCTPTDVANAVVWLLSDAAEMVNGITLTIDGGWSAHG